MTGSSIEHVPTDGHGSVPGHDGPGSDGYSSDGHGVIEPAPHGAVVSYNPDAPSEEWGWHGHWGDFAPRGRAALLWLGVAGLVLMAVFGNQVSHVEDYFLVIIAVLMAGWIVRGNRARKRERRLRP